MKTEFTLYKAKGEGWYAIACIALTEFVIGFRLIDESDYVGVWLHLFVFAVGLGFDKPQPNMLSEGGAA